MMPRQDCPVCGNRPRVFAERLQAQAIARLTAELEVAKKSIAQARVEARRQALEEAAKVAAENEACHVCGCELLPPDTRPHCEDRCGDFDVDHDGFTPTSALIRALRDKERDHG